MNIAAAAAVGSIFLPLVAAFVALVAGRAGPRLALILAPVMVGLALVVTVDVYGGGPFTVVVGGSAPPLGIRLKVDGIAAAFLLTAAVVMAGTVLFARTEFARAAEETRETYAFWPLAFLIWAALATVFLSADLFNLYVALELMTLCAVGLVALRNDPDTVTAALRYLLFAFTGALFYLLGVALLYAQYSTLDVDLLSQRVVDGPAMLAAGGLITGGLLVKGALFPFHAWLPPAHAGAPTPASALLSALVPKAAFFIALRVWFDVMPELAGPLLVTTLGTLGGLAVLYGSAMALRQERLKLIVAYSTVAQIGYLFLVFPLAGGGEPQPWSGGAYTGSALLAMSHAAAKASMFLAAGLVLERVGNDRMESLGGLARTMPATVLAFGLAGVTLMGLPPSGGFVAKYLMLTAAVASGQPVLAAVLVVGGLLAAAYVFRPLSHMLGRPADDGAPATFRPVEVVPLVLAVAAILLGIASAAPYRLIGIGRPGSAVEGLE